jgi:Icc-related predicted phosphoesterase
MTVLKIGNSNQCFFVSDLHGNLSRYHKLFEIIADEPPAALFIGGDLLPSPLTTLSAPGLYHDDFINDFLVKELKKLRENLGNAFPKIFVILGNDDGRMEEAAILDAASQGIWEYCHDRHIDWKGYTIYGYSYVPPSPFQLKDWERYDVSRYVDPGCIAPEDGRHSIPVARNILEFATITEDLEKLTVNRSLGKSIFLFHTPPYKTKLDRAALDGKSIDYAPLDVHIGSIAVKRFIEEGEPLVTLHGHVHESTRITGEWKDQIGRTFAFNAAHEGPELALIKFSLENPSAASRLLL